MDPKSNSGQPLDPKLQEVYDRVMGVNAAGDQTTPPAQPTPPANPAPAAPADQLLQTPPPMEPTNPAPAIPTPAMPTEPVPPMDNPMPTTPTMPEPPMQVPPTEPTPVAPNTAIPPVTPANLGDSETSSALPTEPSAVTPPTNDSMSATMATPQIVHRDTETIKIGGGGNPVAATAKVHKGISPVILIFGAFAFLVVYAVFWVRFFGYNLPFLSQ